MKKYVSIGFLALILSLAFISCDTPATTSVQVSAMKSDPVDNRPVTITVSPSEFALSSVRVEKNEGDGDCSGKGNLFVSYDVSLKGNDGAPFTFGIHAYDCFNRPTEAKDALVRYRLLEKTAIEDIAVTYKLENGAYVPVRVEIKEKVITVAKGKPGKLQPAVLIWQKVSQENCSRQY